MTSLQQDAILLEASLDAPRRRSIRRPLPPVPALPFEPLPPLDDEVRRRARVVALQANERYVRSFLEEHSICPFSRGGRAKGLTATFVHFVEAGDAGPLIDLMAQAAAQPEKAVFQVILPMISVAPDVFREFCHQVTDAANARLPGGLTYAVAPLHPELSYNLRNAYTVIPLFRRAPDPTIQWVRLDVVEALYAGRCDKDKYVHPSEIGEFLKATHRQPLFDKIAETNLKMAHRLGIENVERTLRDIRRDAQKGYQTVLLGGEASEGCSGGCAETRHAARPPATPVAERDGRFALAAVHALPLFSPVRFLVEGVEVVVVRAKDEVHVLYGCCPHRGGTLGTGIVDGEHIVCAYHGWDFRLADGRSDGVPGEGVHRFEARVEDGLVWVSGEEARRVGREVREVFLPEDVVL